MAEVQLPEQVVAQALGDGGMFHLVVAVAVGRRADPFLPRFRVAVPVVFGLGGGEGDGFERRIGIARLVRFARRRFAVFRPVQQRIAGHGFGHFRFEFDGGQLQQADRLAQLRRQDQMLLQRGGEARLHRPQHIARCG